MDSTSATGPSPFPTPSKKIPKASGMAQPPSVSWQPRTLSRRRIGLISCLLMLLLLRLSLPLLLPPWDLVSLLQASHPQDHSPRRCRPPELCLPACLLPCRPHLCHLVRVPLVPPPGLHLLGDTHLTRTPSLQVGCTIQECLLCKCTMGHLGWASITQDHRAPEASLPLGPHLACHTLDPHPWVCHPEDLISGRPWVTQAPCRTTGCAALLH